MKFSISAQTKRKWRNRFIFVAVVTLGILAYVWYINSFDIYDFSHLIVRQDFGPVRPFEPLETENVRVEGKVLAAENEYLALYVDVYTTNIAVFDKRNQRTWYSSPPGTNSDPIANPWERNTMRSHIGFRFFDEGRRRQTRWLFPDSIYHEQFETFSIPNGVRFEYAIGNLDIGIDAIPFLIRNEVFEERIMANIYGYDECDYRRAERNMIRQFWFAARSEEHEGYFMQMTEGIRDSRIHTNNMLAFFERIEWDIYETLEENAASAIEVEISFDFFDMTLEFILDGDRLIANLPLADFQTESLAEVFDIEFLKFFAAGGTDVDGFMLVPSGSGGIINFNAGGNREAFFRTAVYGLDPMLNSVRPQIMQTTRLPILGIQNDGAAVFAHVVNGSSLASVNADASGRTNSYNHAWFSFTVRNSQSLSMDGIPGASGDLTVVQAESYMGDITVMYHFLAGDNPGLGEMAQAYQGFLVETGALTPLDGPGDRTFYLDVLGAFLRRTHFLGTPYNTTYVVSTTEDAHRFVDMLSDGGVDNVQMQLHGWFNRGPNHDVATNVNIINGVSRSRDLTELNERLTTGGGGLNPVVNLQSIFGDFNFFRGWYARGVTISFEIAHDLAGMYAWSGGGNRQLLLRQGGVSNTDWYYLTHPGVLPFHVEDFLQSYERRLGLENLAISDLGDFLVESLHRRNAVNREASKLIVSEQLGIIEEQIPNLVIFGGNDYAIPFASHLLDVPVETDMFHIIDHQVPFYSMVVHGFIEHAGAPANLREHYSAVNVLLSSMTTGASPRYMFTAIPTRELQFTELERMYSTYYRNWMEIAIYHYNQWNNVFRYLRAERIVDFEILAGGDLNVGAGNQVTATVFSDGTRIYVNNTYRDFEADGVTIPARNFVVREGAR